MFRDRLTQLALLAVTATALAAAAALHAPIESARQELGLTIVTADNELAKDPKTALLQAVPGGMRAPFVTYLWIRSQQLKDDGKFFDAMGQRDLICDMMPHFAGVWIYHGWDMAWNISVATHTPEERWMWVHNGIRLLRDKGLYHNPEDLVIHRELAWIFFSKMGERTDEMHWAYKLRWAEMMEFVLGEPPISDDSETVADYFRPIANAPTEPEQLSGPARQLAARLAELQVAGNQVFLREYNRFSGDPLAIFGGHDKPVSKRDRAVAELMSSPDYAEPRAELLAFIRSEVLRKQYRLDPKWMLKLMERYGPLDWRHVHSHAIYWSTMGLYRAKGLDLAEMDLAGAEARLAEDTDAADDLREMHALNTERNVLNALKRLCLTGQIRHDPTGARRRRLILAPDWRFFDSTHREYSVASAHLDASRIKTFGDRNALRDAHINFLGNAVQVLYMSGRRADAQRYYDILRDDVLTAPLPDIYQKNLHDYVIAKRNESGGLTAVMYLAFRHGALVRAYRALANGDTDEFGRSYAFARKVYKTFTEGIGEAPRLSAPPFEQEEAVFLRNLLLDPRSVGMQIPLITKSRLYRQLPPRTKRMLFPAVHQRLRNECEQEGLDFERAFPAPLAPAGRQQLSP